MYMGRMPLPEAEAVMKLVGRPETPGFYSAPYLSRVASQGVNPLDFVAAVEYTRRVAEQQGQKPVMQRWEVNAYVDLHLARTKEIAEAHGFTMGGRNPHAREAIAELRKLLTDKLERKYRVME